MKTNRSFLSAFILLFAVALHAEDKPFEGDTLGKLALGQKTEDVVKLLGKPGSKGASTHWEATGQWVQELGYSKQGLHLKVASEAKAGPQTLLMISATAPCALATGRGIKIGSTEAEVRKAYKDVINAEESEAGKTIVAGSIYGGVICTLTKGKVTEIFIGAAAE
ncbi:MAG TPA: hypothetical protein VGE39_24905 [Prosthecobacter sp.]